MIIKLKIESENFIMPTKGTDSSACYDVYATKIEENDGMVICHLGFSTEIEPGYKGVIAARSNITKYPWVLANGIGIVDSDYRHEWQARFRYIPYKPTVKIDKKELSKTLKELRKYLEENKHSLIDIFPYKVGERVAQIYFEKIDEPEFIMVDETSLSERVGGFGSTGN